MPITEQFGSTFLLCILLLQVVYFRISGAPSSILWGMNLRATDNRSSFVGTFLTLGSAPLVRSHLQMHSSLESSSQSSDFENLSKNKKPIDLCKKHSTKMNGKMFSIIQERNILASMRRQAQEEGRWGKKNDAKTDKKAHSGHSHSPADALHPGVWYGAPRCGVVIPHNCH